MGVSGQHVSGVFLLQCWCPKRYAAKIAYSDNWTAFEEFANCWEYLFSLTTSRAPWFKGSKPFDSGHTRLISHVPLLVKRSILYLIKAYVFIVPFFLFIIANVPQRSSYRKERSFKTSRVCVAW